MIFEIIIRVLEGIFFLVIILEYMGIFLEKKVLSKTSRIILYGAVVVGFATIEEANFWPQINVLLNLMIIVIVSLCMYQGNYYKKMFVTLTVLALGMIAEAIVGYTFLINGISIIEFKNTGSILSKLIFMIIVKVIHQFWRRGQSDDISNLYWSLLLLFPTVSVMIVFCILVLSVNCQDKSLLSLALLSNGAILVLNLALFKIYKEFTRETEVEKKNIVYKKMFSIYDNWIAEQKKEAKELYKLRHDMKHHLFALYTMAEMNEFSKAIEYIEDLIEENHLKKYNIASSGNTLIDSLLNKSCLIAKEKEIDFNLRLEIPYKMNFSDGDLYVILGNALDNAIEAVQKVSFGKKRFIDVTIVYADGKLKIALRNSFNGIIEKNTEGILISSKVDSKNHGIGIYSMEETVKKYNGFFNIDINKRENVFSIVAILYER